MNEKILVVDDEPLILNTIQRALVRKGYAVRVTSTSEAFLAELVKEAADLLIMDLNLAGVNSRSMLGQVHAIQPGARVLFISGVIPEDSEEDFLEKPFRIDDLRDKVREILDRGTA